MLSNACVSWIEDIRFANIAIKRMRIVDTKDRIFANIAIKRMRTVDTKDNIFDSDWTEPPRIRVPCHVLVIGSFHSQSVWLRPRCR